MTHKKSIKDVLNLTITTYSAFDYNFTETSLLLRVDPSLVVQMLAWDGVAYLRDGNLVHVTDWGQVPNDVMREIKSALLTTYPGILSGKTQPNKEGFYQLTGISTTTTVQSGGMIFPGEEILRHHHPDWLGGLEIDVYLPRLDLAFEYQGQQHFHAIRAWGGEKALQTLKDRDLRKAKFCSERGTRLITIDYTESLTEENIRFILTGQMHKK